MARRRRAHGAKEIPIMVNQQTPRQDTIEERREDQRETKEDRREDKRDDKQDRREDKRD
jgi:hypothetical protein